MKCGWQVSWMSLEMDLDAKLPLAVSITISDSSLKQHCSDIMSSEDVESLVTFIQSLYKCLTLCHTASSVCCHLGGGCRPFEPEPADWRHLHVPGCLEAEHSPSSSSVHPCPLRLWSFYIQRHFITWFLIICHFIICFRFYNLNFVRECFFRE